ncbi:MAG: hypothetical protein QXD03_05480 [Candidatus Anstonellales archaeon]
MGRKKERINGLLPYKVYIMGNEIKVFRTTNSVSGVPRYIVHFLSLGLKEYVSNEKTRQAGLRIYRGKDFGGGYIFQSYNLEESLRYILQVLHS